MKKHLHAMLESLIAGETDEANTHLHAYLTSKTRTLMIGEMDDEEDEDDKDEKKGKKGKKGKKDDSDDSDDDKDDDDDSDKDDDDDDSDEDDSDDDKPAFLKKKSKKVKESALSHSAGYQKNEKGEVYHKVPHKDTSTGYGHNKSKAAARKLNADSDSGANAKKGDCYKDKPHKDNSMSADSKGKGSKGLKNIKDGHQSPDSDGKKDNRRTDKTAKYHGTDRGGKDVSAK